MRLRTFSRPPHPSRSLRRRRPMRLVCAHDSSMLTAIHPAISIMLA